MDEAAELEALRREWALIDVNDPESLRRWFTRHKHLTVNDHAQITQLAACTIYKYKRRAGIPKKCKSKPPGHRRPKSILTIPIPEDWRTNAEWLRRACNTYGIRAVARGVNRDESIVRVLLRRLNVRVEHTSSLGSRSPCFTHEWCHRHYVTLGYSVTKCAKLAGISMSVFIDWLNHFKIRVRTPAQKMRKCQRLTFWERRLVGQLKEQAIVSKVHQYTNYIHVRYYDYFWDNFHVGPRKKHVKRPYTYFRITPENSRLKRVPPVHYEFGTDIEGKAEHPAHIAISRADFNKSSVVEQRLAIHEFCRQIITRGWIWPSYPAAELARDLERVQNANPAKYMERGGFTAIPKPGPRNPPGRKLMLHYFDTSVYWECLKHPKLVVKYLNRMAKRTCDLNLFNLILRVAANDGFYRKYKIPPRLPDPVAYSVMFKRLGFTGKILDVSCNMGNRAVAAAATGLTYVTGDPAFKCALDHGIEEMLNYEPDVGQPVDVVLYDESWQAPNMQKVLPYIERGKRLFVFCPHEHQEVVLQYKPKSAIQFRTRLYDSTPGLLFYW
jgi:hypothetical protein